jgi:hypothetical protein
MMSADQFKKIELKIPNEALRSQAHNLRTEIIREKAIKKCHIVMARSASITREYLNQGWSVEQIGQR